MPSETLSKETLEAKVRAIQVDNEELGEFFKENVRTAATSKLGSLGDSILEKVALDKQSTPDPIVTAMGMIVDPVIDLGMHVSSCMITYLYQQLEMPISKQDSRTLFDFMLFGPMDNPAWKTAAQYLQPAIMVAKQEIDAFSDAQDWGGAGEAILRKTIFDTWGNTLMNFPYVDSKVRREVQGKSTEMSRKNGR